jgi:hypothetical protein
MGACRARSPRSRIFNTCAWPLLASGVCARAADVGSDRSALLRVRAACRGMHVGGIERARCGSRAVAVLSEGTLGKRCDYGVLKGHPIPWVRCAGTVGALWVRRSTSRAAESASGVQTPRQQRADGERAELALRAHQAFIPVCGPFLPMALALVRLMLGRIGRLWSERAACLRHRAGALSRAVRQQGCCSALRGDPWHAM